VTGLQILAHARRLWAGSDLYRATPTATRDLSLYGLIQKTGTYVPQWDSIPRHKDHQIIAPDALTTAPRRWLYSLWDECIHSFWDEFIKFTLLTDEQPHKRYILL
jgi:hypothetical protein